MVEITREMVLDALTAYWGQRPRNQWTPATQAAMRDALTVAFRLAEQQEPAHGQSVEPEVER